MEEIAEILEELGDDGYRDIAGKVAGNIHKEKFRKFWLQKLKPDSWTRDC